VTPRSPHRIVCRAIGPSVRICGLLIVSVCCEDNLVRDEVDPRLPGDRSPTYPRRSSTPNPVR